MPFEMENISQARRKWLFEKRTPGFRPEQVAALKASVLAAYGPAAGLAFWRESLSDAQRMGLAPLYDFSGLDGSAV